MNKSESIGELAAALVKVQSKLKPAHKSAENPFYKSKYADLTSVWDSCRDLLAENGLAVVQTTDYTENGSVAVESILVHTSGEFIGGVLELPVSKHDAQGVGSAITYGRRYGLAALVGIVADEDDDGNRAVESVEKVAKETKRDKMVKRVRQLEAKVKAPAKNVAKMSDDEIAEYGKELADKAKE